MRMRRKLIGCLIFAFGFMACSILQAEPGIKHGGKVARAIFTSDILQREPVDSVVFLGDSSTEVYFFTEVLYMTGHKVFHRWEKDGELISSVSFDVGGPRWRVYSKKLLDEETYGRWTVVVTDEDGWPLVVKMFIHGASEMGRYLREISSADANEPDAEEDGSEPNTETDEPAEMPFDE